MDWIASLLTFLALWLNGRKNIACWPMWLVSNVLWIVYASWRKEWALLVVNLGFIVLNMLGWRKWYRDENPPAMPTCPRCLGNGLVLDWGGNPKKYVCGCGNEFHVAGSPA